MDEGFITERDQATRPISAFRKRGRMRPKAT